MKGRYLVTGGAGFIGSHLCDRLLSLGAEVVCVDNFFTGQRQNLKTLLPNKNFSLIEADIVKEVPVTGAFAGVFHMASPASPVDYYKYPIETLRIGSIGTENVLKVALEKKCPVLLASTSEIYGDPLEHPQKETYWGNVNSLGPRSCYDEAKRYLEALAMAYWRQHDLQIRIIRIFNTYGPRMRAGDGRVVPNLCLQALEGKPLTVYGTGSQTRSFCYVDDLVSGIVKVMESNDTGPFNLGNPTETTVLEFAKAIIRLTESKSQIVYQPLPQDDPQRRKPDITKAETKLGWSPKVKLDEGLRHTIDFFRV